MDCIVLLYTYGIAPDLLKVKMASDITDCILFMPLPFLYGDRLMYCPCLSVNPSVRLSQNSFERISYTTGQTFTKLTHSVALVCSCA